MQTVERAYYICGYHVYKEVWDSSVGEDLKCQRELSNTKDCYAVTVLRDGTIVSHLPKRISLLYSLFI